MDGDSNDPPPPFKIDPAVAALLTSGREARWATDEIGAALDEVIDQLLVEYPGRERAISSALESAAQRLNSHHEQHVRREREARQKRESRNGANGVSKGNVSTGVAAVPGDEPKAGGAP